MAYRIDSDLQSENSSIIIDGFEGGIASSPYMGISNIRNLNTSYYPGVAYVNYARQAVTLSSTGGLFFAGSHSLNVSNNIGWLFTSGPTLTMANPAHKATSNLGLNYILDTSGQVWKQSSVNSSTFNLLGGGTGRLASGAQGLAYWNNYLVVFGAGYIEFCGNGTGDAGITSSNWNLPWLVSNITYTQFTASTSPSELTLAAAFPEFFVNDPVQFTTTGTLPSPLTTNTTYYITSIGSSPSVVQVATAPGGSDIVYVSTGSGTHTITNTTSIVPLGNVDDLTFSGDLVPDDTSGTISSYTTPSGAVATSEWQGATGQYNIVAPSGDNILATFTRGSATVTFLSPIVFDEFGTFSVNILDTSSNTYKTYVSKVDGNLYFANGRNIGRILSQNSNTVFNPGSDQTYVVDYAVTTLLQQSDSVVDMTDNNSTLIIAGNKDLYTWDYISTSVTAPNPVGEQIVKIINLLNNIYILAGQKGNVYISNGYSSQLFTKLPDFISGVFDPVWSWGDIMVHRSKLFFQSLAQTTSGTNILAGIFSLIVSPAAIGEKAEGLIMEAQNSYGLTPASGALQNGVLIDNSPSSTGYDSYYSAWSNGASTGGIDYNDTTLWQNFEPAIETDIIPIGTIMEKQTFGLIEFKLDRPMTTGDQIRLSWRPSLSDSYTLMGTTTTAQLSDYYNSNIQQAQWAQFKVEFKCASSGSSRIPIREIRLHYGNQ